jgi:hypothetical protein
MLEIVWRNPKPRWNVIYSVSDGNRLVRCFTRKEALELARELREQGHSARAVKDGRISKRKTTAECLGRVS